MTFEWRVPHPLRLYFSSEIRHQGGEGGKGREGRPDWPKLGKPKSKCELLSMASSSAMKVDVSRWRKARPRIRVTRDASDGASDEPGEFSLPLSERLLSRRASTRFQFESLFPNSILLSAIKIN